LDKVSVGPGARLVYHSTLVNQSSTDIDAEAFSTKMQADSKAVVCQNEATRATLNRGVTYAYSISGSDGAEIAQFEIHGSNCEDQN
jgi:hypothetical protein